MFTFCIQSTLICGYIRFCTYVMLLAWPFKSHEIGCDTYEIWANKMIRNKFRTTGSQAHVERGSEWGSAWDCHEKCLSSKPAYMSRVWPKNGAQETRGPGGWLYSFRWMCHSVCQWLPINGTDRNTTPEHSRWRGLDRGHRRAPPALRDASR